MLSPNFLMPLVVLICLPRLIVDGRRLKQSAPNCQNDECLLKPRHFSLYSSIKQAMDSDFNLNGKDVIPLLRSIEVLERRFSLDNDKMNEFKNGEKLGVHQLVDTLLRHKKLVEAIKVFNSGQGQSLINLYGSSLNGQNQNLACSEWRIKQIEYAEKKMEQNVELAKIFSNIHKNFLKKSVKKCLKHSCNSIDENMSRIDSVLRRPSKFGHWALEDKPESGNGNEISEISANSTDDNQTINNNETSDMKPMEEREFEQEELELCRFFKRTNDIGCRISGKELGDISLLNGQSKIPIMVSGARLVDDLIRDYQTAGGKSTGYVDFVEDKQPNESIEHEGKQVSTFATLSANSNDSVVASTTTIGSTTIGATSNTISKEDNILAKCHTMKPLLKYNLAGLRWYLSKRLIDQRKLVSRANWCPSLAYWLEIDRLCDELEQTLASSSADTASGDTFSYL